MTRPTMLTALALAVGLLMTATSAAADPLVLSASADVLRLETADPTPIPVLWDDWAHPPSAGPVFQRTVAYGDTLLGMWSAALDGSRLALQVRWPDHDPDNPFWGTVGFEAHAEVVVIADQDVEFVAERAVDGDLDRDLVAVSVRTDTGGSHLLLVPGSAADTGEVTLPAGIYTVEVTFDLAETDGHHACRGDLAVSWVSACIPVRPLAWSSLQASYR